MGTYKTFSERLIADTQSGNVRQLNVQMAQRKVAIVL